MRGKAKTAHINVRMTEEERAAIMARSSSFGMAPSTFMREAALSIGEKPSGSPTRRRCGRSSTR